MYITICEIGDQSKFNALKRAFKAGAVGKTIGMEWGERWEGVQNGETHIHPWLIHVNVWQ